MSVGLSQAFRAASRYMPRRSLASSGIVLLLACSVVSWEEYMDAGYDALQGGRYAESEEMFLVAAQLAERFSPDDDRRATTWNNLADLYRAQARYRDAEPWYRRALESLVEILGPEHLRVAGGLDNLAGFYFDQGSYGEAEPLYWNAVRIVEDTLWASRSGDRLKPRRPGGYLSPAGSVRRGGATVPASPDHRRAHS